MSVVQWVNMKILIASDLHYPTINGVATFSRSLARGLSARGHEVLVIAPSQTGKRYKEVDGNHPIYRTASVPFPFYQNFRISLTPSREVKKIIEDFDPDVIHIQMLMWIGQACMKYGNKFGIPIVSTNHAMPENLMDNMRLLAPVARPINYMLSEYGRRFHSKADCVTMPTQSAIDMFGVGEKLTSPLLAISNGIDLGRFQPGVADPELYSKFHIPTDKPIVSYVGRLDAEKHLGVLLKAFAEIHKETNAHLLIVGDGTDADNLRAQAHDLHIVSHITFTGRVSDDEIVALHKVGTVFCMPSPAELQSIAALEAMASGQPIVAVDAGALRELCQNDINGYLCDQDNVEQIAAGLKKILLDKDLRQTFSAASSAIANTHDINHTLDQFLDLYQHVIDGVSVVPERESLQLL
jgi:glycosyltransferase involved in cell wall biosynthesis